MSSYVLSARLLLTLVVLFFLLFYKVPVVQGGNSPDQVNVRGIVEQAMRDYVKRSDVNKVKGVIGVGSWMTGSRYRNPLTSLDPSDHDMTPVFDRQKMTRKQMIKEWKEMQNFMRKRITFYLHERMPTVPADQVNKVLKSVNIYPPDEIMAGVRDEKEAFRRFKSLGSKPNLGGGPVEGIWGRAKQPFTQAYAESAGRTYFKDIHGRVRRGFVDLDNLAAGYGKFSLQASNELCEQFAKKVRLAMSQGRGADALKNLRRLDQYLKKAGNASGLHGFEAPSPGLTQVLKNADNLDTGDAETMHRWLEKNKSLLHEGLTRVDDRLLWLNEVAKLDDASRLKFIRTMRADKRRRFMSWAKKLYKRLNQAGNKGRAAVKKVPWNKVFGAAVALGTAIELYDAVSLYRRDGWVAANQSLSLAIIGLIPSSLLAQVALDYASEVGYDLVSVQQDCLDLMAGIYAVKGRERLVPGEQIASLASRCIEESCVIQTLRKRAEEASHKDLKKEGYAGIKGDRAIAARLMQRCQPVVLKAWKGERYKLLTQVIRDKNDIDRIVSGTGMVLNAKAISSDREVKIFARPYFFFSCNELMAGFLQMRNDLKLLGGPEKLGQLRIAENYQWSVQRFSYLQGRWLPLKQYPAHHEVLYVWEDGKDLLRKIKPLRIRLAEGPDYRVILEYNLRFVPGLAVDDWRAPEVEEFRPLLRGSYRFHAMAPLKTGHWKLAVSGPRFLTAGATGQLSARVRGRAPWAGEKDFLPWIEWVKEPDSHALGRGEQLEIKGPPAGKIYRYRALLMGKGAGGLPVCLAETGMNVAGRSRLQRIKKDPRPKISMDCGRYNLMTVRTEHFSENNTTFTRDNARHSDRTMALQVPGPGTLRITVTSSGRHQYANHEYGFARWRARVTLAPNLDMGFKGGWLAGGKYFPGVIDEGKNSYSWHLNSGGSLSLAVSPEVCQATSANGHLICCSCCNTLCAEVSHPTFIQLPGTHEVRVEFQPDCPDRDTLERN